VLREITRRISFGMGVPAQVRVDHPVLDKICNAEFVPERKLSQLAESQLGTAARRRVPSRRASSAGSMGDESVILEGRAFNRFNPV
jgi:hypothetical protein